MVHLRDTKLYDILGISSDASVQDIKKAYRVKALKYHPDKNGHSEDAKHKFQEICEAYEILHDDSKREMYERYGTTDQSQWPAMQEKTRYREPTGMSAGDLFAQFFGGGSTTVPSFFGDDMDLLGRRSRTARPKGPVRGPDIKHLLRCTLEEIYRGKETKLALKRTRLCQTCDGKGGLQWTACENCDGRGMKTQTQRHGPIMQSWSSTCGACSGEGTFLKSKDVCNECQGQGFIGERKIFDVRIEKGMESGQELILPGEADEVVSTKYGSEKVVPGDVIITMEQIPHPSFRRRADYGLILDKCLVGLKTSLCGGSVWLDSHPSGKTIKIDVLPGEILQPGAVKCIANLGMPTKDGGFGHLYIKFEVLFPSKLNTTTLSAIGPALDKDENVRETEQSSQSSKHESQPIEEHVISGFVPNLKRSCSTGGGDFQKRQKG
ncbi:LANO_0H08196g1_1 [Lachancea nothofagi CBS 11611]|uniref:LANO_0H08196g1_1 n=1 Tax=Lachancea nothofagi CBS 11611 TaxID=1266666 RepID=A0A1G4KLV6_9SACH|nr:LANO_0H08196g1_1 [Lachancea nothofagi CBS 11611]